jgi:hypothetical protein
VAGNFLGVSIVSIRSFCWIKDVSIVEKKYSIIKKLIPTDLFDIAPERGDALTKIVTSGIMNKNKYLCQETFEV